MKVRDVMANLECGVGLIFKYVISIWNKTAGIIITMKISTQFYLSRLMLNQGRGISFMKGYSG